MKIAIITNNSKNLAKSRKKLIQSFIDNNYEVVGICPKEEYTEQLKEMGVIIKIVKNNQISTNIFGVIKYFINLKKVLKQEKPDIVFNYTIKPCIIGTLAAKITNTPRIYSMITGQGYIYSTNKFRVRVIRLFCNLGYKFILKYNTRVIFQNKEDREDFVSKKYIEKSKAFVVDGSGVDLERFKYCKLPNDFNFLMIARTLDVKGVKEFCEASKIIKDKYKDVSFTFIGEIEKNYRGIKIRDIEKYKNIVNFKEYTPDVLPYLQECKVFVLPTYLKEGIPRTLLEALAVGRPIITTDVRGCRETVKNGKNGVLVKPQDSYDLSEKMEYMIKKENELEKMAKFSHEYAKERFDVNIINKKMLEIMQI